MAATSLTSHARGAGVVLCCVCLRVRIQPRMNANEHEPKALVLRNRPGIRVHECSFAVYRMKTKILIVEDDPHILLGLEEVLKSDGFEVAVCNRGDQAMEAISKQRPALIVLDVMLPGKSGYGVCKELRGKKVATPILMLTAKGQELDKVVGLDLGADDYVTKPFGVRELLARIHALLRRTSGEATAAVPPETPFEIGPAKIDPRTFQLTRGKTVEELTARELKLLQLFFAHASQVLSRD